MRKLSKLLGLLLISVLLLSCDPMYNAKINNKTSNDIQVEIYFNLAHWSSKPSVVYLKSIGIKPGVQLVKFDSVNLISLYNINKDSSFTLASGIGTKLDLQEYKKIIIYSNDTIVLGSPAEIEKAMVENGIRNWEMNIK
jgi:hypothetical protein